MKLRATGMLAMALALGACQGGAPSDDEMSDGTVRNVVARIAEPQHLEVSIKLPVVIRPQDEYELRSAVAGSITALPYEEGDTIPAGRIPEATWLEADEFIEAYAGEEEPTAREIQLRNIAHLNNVETFARINDRQLLQSLREAQQNYDQAVRDLRRTEDYPESTGAELDRARTARDMARVAVERTIATLEDAYLCSPARGVLTELVRKQGEYVAAGELVGRLAVMDRLIAELEIPEADRSALATGDKLDIVIGSVREANGDPTTRVGTILRIDQVAHPETHSFTVDIAIPNEDFSLPAGVFGTTRVVIYSRPDALVVPISAINLNGDEKSVFIVNEDNTVTEMTDLDLGRITHEWAEIRNRGLQGKRVVTFGAQNLSGGDRINWTDEDPYVVNRQGTGESS